MDTLPIELVTIIAVDSFELFTTLLRVATIGNRLCEQYPQQIAKEKFISYLDASHIKFIFLNGRLHSFNEQPAVVKANGTIKWYRYGNLHRENDLPAAIYSYYKEWYWRGQLHRENDLPAVEYSFTGKEWYQHGVRHRDGDLPAIHFKNDREEWYQYGKPHRGDGLPAIVYSNGYTEWRVYGRRHRDNNLPAVIHANGSKEWYIDGEFIKRQN